MRQAERGDLTQGPLEEECFYRAPFLGSSLIQQLYNTVDLIFVGRLLGTDAAAAVGAGSLLITLVLGFFTGMSVGVSVSVSHAYGAGNQKELHELIHCAAGLALVSFCPVNPLRYIFHAGCAASDEYAGRYYGSGRCLHQNLFSQYAPHGFL